jgi:flagellar assembly protein FliH
MRSSSEPWEALDALLGKRELPSPEDRVFKRVRIAGVCRVPSPLSAQAAVRLEGQPALDLESLLEGERERAREEGLRAGFEEGFREGLRRAEEQARDLVLAALALREAMERVRREALLSLEPELAEMALEVGEKLALQRLEEDPGALREMIRSVASRATERKGMRVRLHPRDLHLLRQSGETGPLLADAEGLELVEDPELRPGDCVMETAAGTIDARLEVRRRRVEAALLGGGEEPALPRLEEEKT